MILKINIVDKIILNTHIQNVLYQKIYISTHIKINFNKNFTFYLIKYQYLRCNFE